jgi:hypothetical protein
MSLGYLCDWPHDEVELACACGFYELRGKRELAKIYGVLCPMEKIADQLRYPCAGGDCGVYYPDAELVVTGFEQPESE